LGGNAPNEVNHAKDIPACDVPDASEEKEPVVIQKDVLPSVNAPPVEVADLS